MTIWETIKTAISNTFRSKLRTTLTILAIFVGAFTLTLTNGVGTGISNYIDAQVASLGSGSTISVTKAEGTAATSGPARYDPGSKVVTGQQPGTRVVALTEADIRTIADVPGVTKVVPTLVVAPDYVELAGSGAGKFQLALAPFSNPSPLLDAGVTLDESSQRGQILLPSSYVTPLGFASPEAAVGKTVTIGITDAAGDSHTVDAEVVGVASATLISGAGVEVNNALTSQLRDLQKIGLPSTAVTTYASATASFAPGSSDAEVSAIKAGLVDDGFTAQTVKDQLGMFQTVISAIILVLNSFAVIALVAAGFGIINTLLMSVQERTREIGLMKAMGMGAGKVFALFSFEAIFIGFLGAAIGSGVAIGLGTLVSVSLANGPLSGLAGLQILSFSPASVAAVILLIMAIAFVAGTLPASRASRQDPIDALRYE